MSIERGEIVEIIIEVDSVFKGKVPEFSGCAVDIPGALCYDNIRQVSVKKARIRRSVIAGGREPGQCRQARRDLIKQQ
jgi:hypothetical protein